MTRDRPLAGPGEQAAKAVSESEKSFLELSAPPSDWRVSRLRAVKRESTHWTCPPVILQGEAT